MTNSLKRFFKNLDYFGVVPELQMNSQKKYRSHIGGVVFLVWTLGIFSFLAYSFEAWVNKKFMNLISSSKVEIPSPKLNMLENKFMAAIGLMYEDYSLAHFDLEGYVVLSAMFETVKDTKKSSKKKVKIPLRKCNYEDFEVISKERIDALNLTYYLCPNKTDFTLEGLFTSSNYSLLKFVVEIEPEILQNQTKTKFLNNLFVTETIRANVYFTDTAINVDNRTDPIYYYINNWFTFLDMTNYKRVHLEYMKTPFTDDGSILFNDPVTNYIMKYHSGREYGYAIPDRTNKKISDAEKFVTFYLRSYENIWTLKREFQKLTMFLASVTSISSGSLICLVLLMKLVNEFKLTQSLINKTVFVKENFTRNDNLIQKLNQISNEIKNDHTEAVLRLNSRNDLVRMNTNNVLSSKNELKNIKDHSSYNNILSVKGAGQNFQNRIASSKGVVSGSREYPVTFLNKTMRLQTKKTLTKKPDVIKFSTCQYMCNLLLCKNRSGSLENKAYSLGTKKIGYYKDILTIIKKLQEVDLMKQILFTKEQKSLIDFLSKPIISVANSSREVADYEELLSKEKSISDEELENVYMHYKLMKSNTQTMYDINLLKIFDVKIQQII